VISAGLKPDVTISVAPMVLRNAVGMDDIVAVGFIPRHFFAFSSKKTADPLSQTGVQ